MKKVTHCKNCGGDGHYAINCCSYWNTTLKTSKVIKNKTSKVLKKPSRSKAKKDAWTAFATYIRKRDCLKTTGTFTYGKCVTCMQMGIDKVIDYARIQAGHAVGGRGNAVLFNEELVFGQCDYCNCKPPYGLGGNYSYYTLFLIDKYGREHAEELLKLKYQTKVYKLHDFIEIKDEYEKKTLELLA